MNRVKEIQRVNAKDVALQLKADTVGNAGKWDVNKSWHAQYKDSAYVYAGGLPLDLSEGDLIVIFSQFGEVVDVNMPRDQKTGKPKGFCFVAYEDQRSTVLAVDNLNGAVVLGRTLRCDHCLSFHEEQKKDPNAVPDHVARKLSEKELEEKKLAIAARNAELDEANAAKSDLFAVARGTGSTPAEEEEAALRQQVLRDKEGEAQQKRSAHIEQVLQKRKRETQAALSEEARKEAARKAWIEEKKAERKLLPPPGEVRGGAVAVRGGAPSSSAGGGQADSDDELEGGAQGGAVDTAWERMMGGGKKKKKKHKEKREKRGRDDEGGRSGAAGRDESGKAGEGISVDETNRLRATLGLAPLKS